MRIITIADTHIRNLKYHQEYREIFQDLYKKVKAEKPDCIVHLGDLAHSKINLSPEYFSLATEFIDSLSNIAPLHIILGNHDVLLSNPTRQDAVTPIIDALNKQNINFMKYYDSVEIGENVVLHCLSIIDEKSWKSPRDKEKINCALYHGPIIGAKTHDGWYSTSGKEKEMFAEYDYAFLGDIHLPQTMDQEGRIRYTGSTICQNFGERGGKGFLVWDIRTKKDFDVRLVELINPKPFVTINLNDRGEISDTYTAPPGARIRLVSKTNLTYNTTKEAIDEAHRRFSPDSVVFLNETDSKPNIGGLIKEYEGVNIRDTSTQADLIKDFLKGYSATEELTKEVESLNNKYCHSVALEAPRNVKWKIKRLEFSNLFNYGENNVIDFDSLSGVAGIFGKSFSGKSSIIENILYTMFNNTSKNIRKNYDVINQNKKHCHAKIILEMDNNTYVIERMSEKYEKTLKGVTTEEAKTMVEFYMVDVAGEEISLNGESRLETDKIIRSIFGTMEDFLLTSMSSQFGSTSFIDEGSTKRKEILAKFLDLDVFEQRYQAAKDDVVDLRSNLKRLGTIEFDKEIKTTSEKLDEIKKKLAAEERTKKKNQKIIDNLNRDLVLLNERLKNVSNNILDIEEVKRDKDAAEKRLEKYTAELESIKTSLKEKNELKAKIDNFVKNDFNIDEHLQKQQRLRDARGEIQKITTGISKSSSELKINQKKTELLKQVPCGSEFSHCKFIKDAYAAIGEVARLEGEIEEHDIKLQTLREGFDEQRFKKVDDSIKKYNDLVTRGNKNNEEIIAASSRKAKCESLIAKEQNNIKNCNADALQYEQHKEQLEEARENMALRQQKTREVKALQRGLEQANKQIQSDYLLMGSLTHKIKELEVQSDELRETRIEYEAYDLLLKFLHPNGIQSEIIRRSLPVINNEIQKILSNMTKFQVFFDLQDNKLELYIQHGGYDRRPLEGASGAEKTIASMAIRLALIKITTLPLSELFILDEPATALDSLSMEGFIQTLEYLKTQFSCIVLISHTNILKDTANVTIEIEKDDKGYARVNI